MDRARAVVRTLGRVRSRSRTEQRWLIQAVVALGLARAALVLLPFERVARLIGLQVNEPMDPAGSGRTERVDVVGWAVRAAAPRVPWKATCLVQAVAAGALLRLVGARAVLYLGVASEPGTEVGIAAHAWLRCGTTVVVGEPGHERFTVLATFQ